MGRWNNEARLNSRWYASWLLAAAYLPILLLYVIWIPASLMGKISGEGTVVLSNQEGSECGENWNISNHKSSCFDSSSEISEDVLGDVHDFGNCKTVESRNFGECEVYSDECNSYNDRKDSTTFNILTSTNQRS